MAAYFIILFAFTLTSASYIVALRECAVVWGAWMGVLFLREPVTIAMIAGTATIVTGALWRNMDCVRDRYSVRNRDCEREICV